MGVREALRPGRQARVAAPAAVPKPSRQAQVSVIIPCYNYGRFLAQAVSSALAQDDVDLQVIIVDDASTDDSATIAQRFASNDQRVQVILHRQNLGHSVSFNDGCAAATGEFIVRLDADDLLTPGSLGRAVALFDAFPHVGLVYGHPRHFTAAIPAKARERVRGWSVWSGEDWITARCRAGVNCITTPEAMVRAKVVEAVGRLTTDLSFANDLEMWLRIASASDVGRVDGPDQAFHRDHPESMTGNEHFNPLVDLVERRSVFELFFSGPGRELARGAELHNAAKSALADQALLEACRAYDRGRTESVDVPGYVKFALATCPAARELQHWRALQRRRRIGVRLAPLPPFFTAILIWRRIHWKLLYWRWQRTGL